MVARPVNAGKRFAILISKEVDSELVPFDDLPHDEHSHESEGREYGDVPFSVILGHSKPRLRKSGDGELRLTAIHGAGRFDTKWLAGLDETWTSKPKANR
jgi:hypothetical protein